MEALQPTSYRLQSSVKTTTVRPSARSGRTYQTPSVVATSFFDERKREGTSLAGGNRPWAVRSWRSCSQWAFVGKGGRANTPGRTHPICTPVAAESLPVPTTKFTMAAHISSSSTSRESEGGQSSPHWVAATWSRVR